MCLIVCACAACCFAWWIHVGHKKHNEKQRKRHREMERKRMSARRRESERRRNEEAGGPAMAAGPKTRKRGQLSRQFSHRHTAPISLHTHLNIHGETHEEEEEYEAEFHRRVNEHAREEMNRKALVEFYERVAPERLENPNFVDSIIKSFGPDLEDVFLKMERKYPGEHIKRTAPLDDREALTRFYRKVSPEKVAHVDVILDQFGDDIEKLYGALERKYPKVHLVRPGEIPEDILEEAVEVAAEKMEDDRPEMRRTLTGNSAKKFDRAMSRLKVERMTGAILKDNRRKKGRKKSLKRVDSNVWDHGGEEGRERRRAARRKSVMKKNQRRAAKAAKKKSHRSFKDMAHGVGMVAAAAQNSMHKKKLIKKTFDTIDADGSGHIDFGEFKEACGSDDDAAVRKLFDLLDEDGGGTIEKEELVHALKNNEEASKLAEQFPHLKAMFDAERTKREERKSRRSMRRSSTAYAGRHSAESSQAALDDIDGLADVVDDDDEGAQLDI